MKLEIYGTINQKRFIASDPEDDNAPLLSLEFHNDMSCGILYEDKLEIAKKVLTDAAELCFKALMKGVSDESRKS